jgi:hypothetical protein
MSERGWRAYDYMESRGIPSSSIKDSGLGLFPSRDHVALQDAARRST